MPGTRELPKVNGRYIPELDGVRGAAILAVMAYHVARVLTYTGSHEQTVQGLLSTGWIGVDLFFVLSGFLITGILLDAKGRASFFRTFYARRVLRIVPVYIVFVAVATIVAPALGWTTPQDADTLHRAQGWYWTYLVNVLIARQGWRAAVWHTGHLWSLSVEEQFYLLWPAIVFASSRRTLLRVAVALGVCAVVGRAALVMAGGPTVGMYVLLPARVDGLIVGAMLAVLARDPEGWRQLRRLMPFMAVAAVVALVLIYRRDLLAPTETWTEIAAYPSLALLGGAAIISGIDPRGGSIARRLWAHPLLRFFGRYSYGLYLWHQLAFAWFAAHILPPSRLPVIAGSHLPGHALFIVLAFAVSVGWALASWYLVEYPFLRLKRFAPYYTSASKNLTTPVSSEYLAPTITKPSF